MRTETTNVHYQVWPLIHLIFRVLYMYLLFNLCLFHDILLKCHDVVSRWLLASECGEGQNIAYKVLRSAGGIRRFMIDCECKPATWKCQEPCRHSPGKQPRRHIHEYTANVPGILYLRCMYMVCICLSRSLWRQRFLCRYDDDCRQDDDSVRTLGALY